MEGAVNASAGLDSAASLADRAYLELRDRLVMLDIRPGDPINEDALGRELELGRTPIREALKRLTLEHLVVAYPRRGTFATDVNIADLSHIFEVRRTIEPMAAGAAAARGIPEDAELLTGLLAELDNRDTSLSATEQLRLDLRVHRAIYRGTHNPYFETTLLHYDNLATRIWCVFAPRLADVAGHVAEHRPLLQAILAGDATKSAALAGEHVDHFESAIRALI